MDETQDKPASGAPMLQPVHLVWPRPSDGGSWKLLWFGVAFVIAGLLPWHGELDRVLTLDSGIQMPAGIYRHQVAQNQVNPGLYPAPSGKIVGIDDPARPWASMMILLTGVAMVIAGAVNVWHGRLQHFTPILMAMVMNFVAIWFTKANWVYERLGDNGETVLLQNASRPNPFSHLMNALSSIPGVMEHPGATNYEAFAAAQRSMGPGAYLAVFTDCFLLIYVLAMLFIGFRAAKSKEAENGGARRSGSSRSRKPAGPLPGSGAPDKKSSDDS